MAVELASFGAPIRAIVIGAGGGVGAAFVDALAACDAVADVLAIARRPLPPVGKIRTAVADVTDERALSAAAAKAPTDANLVIVATGVLHGADLPHAPEKQLKDLDPETLARTFAVNTVGPALAIKHFAPLLTRSGKSVFAALSARVGSISDNRLGGWYGYRASKAALNMILRTAAIEIGARRKEAIVLGLHPGTVDTGLSKPFQSSAKTLFSPAESAAHLLSVIDRATAADSGSVLAWDGQTVPF